MRKQCGISDGLFSPKKLAPKASTQRALTGLENVTGLLVFTNLGALVRLALNMWIRIISDWCGSPKMASSARFGVVVMMEELDGVRRSLRTVRLRHGC